MGFEKLRLKGPCSLRLGQYLSVALFWCGVGLDDLNNLLRHKNSVALSSSDFLHDPFPKKLVNILLGSSGGHF